MEFFKLLLFTVLYTFSETFQNPLNVGQSADNNRQSGRNNSINSRTKWGLDGAVNKPKPVQNFNQNSQEARPQGNEAKVVEAREPEEILRKQQQSKREKVKASKEYQDNNVAAGNQVVGANPAIGDINNAASQNNHIPESQNVHTLHPEMVDGIDRHAQMAEEVSHKGSSRVVWDWHDFSVNMEDYVIPEQKVRRSPISTAGEPWPFPQYYITKSKIFRLSKNFNFSISKQSCDVIVLAIKRYKKTIVNYAVSDLYDNLSNAQGFHVVDIQKKYESAAYRNAQTILDIRINIQKPCKGVYPSDKSDESYDLVIKGNGCYLTAKEVWGALKGLETLSQLVVRSPDNQLFLKDTVISDYPRFSHRGVMIDTSRHFLYKEVILNVLEGMAQNKMNVLHWHMVDDQSFPYESKVFPELSQKGAYHPSMVYSHKDISEIIQFARLRGIRVLPEFDNPGHTYSWGLGRPDILTQCYERGRPVYGYLGPINPTKNTTYTFLRTLLSEILHVFKDKYIHLGGDEVPLTCWQSNPDVTRFASQITGTSEIDEYSIRRVLEYYERQVIKDLTKIGKTRSSGVRVVLWQEVLNNNLELPNDTIIQIWQGDMYDVERASKRGHQVVFSTCWYLDLIEYGIKWPKYYTCDPADTSGGYDFEEKDVLGGEACLWAEYIDNEEVMTRLWPSASAVAERLWSNKDVKDVDKAARRLYEHRCRMLSRGLQVGQISGPDYCPRKARFHSQSTVDQVEQGCEGCSEQFNASGMTFVAVFVFAALLGAVAMQYTKNSSFVGNLKACRSRSIMFSFMILLLLYVMCYTTIWVHIMDLRKMYPWRQNAA